MSRLHSFAQRHVANCAHPPPTPSATAMSLQSIVNTLLGAVEVYGYVPNGLRRYYLNRSQPPLLSQVLAGAA